MDETRISRLVASARAEGRDALTEVEGLELLAAMGLEAPSYHFISGSKDVAGLAPFPGPRAVVKVISPAILHKTEVGGVAIVENSPAAIKAAIADMEGRFATQAVQGYTVNEFVPFEPRLGHEIIVGFRFAPDFGPVVSFGPGGIYTEFLAKSFKTGAANLFFSPSVADRGSIERALRGSAVYQLTAGGMRNTKPAIEGSRLVDLACAFVSAAPVLAAAGVTEFECNPCVIAKRPGDEPRIVALDVLVKVGDPASAGSDLTVVEGKIVNRRQAERPLEKIDCILAPKSAAVIGVSEKGMNNGRIILRNLLDNGFDRSRLYVVKAGATLIDGCRCFPSVAALPEPVDLLVIVIPAQGAAEVIAEISETGMAKSAIVIPGGLEEKSGTEGIVARMNASLDASRKGPGGGPLLNGGNCLGIRSVPGKYNTLFIPRHKLPMPTGRLAPVAVISQSGAFAICRVSKHQRVNPKYVITCGNQMDLTMGDYLEYLEKDNEIELFAVYVEGFKPLDGEKLLRACKRICDSGRNVVFYRAGRTAAGAAASASHTASIAGDYPVTRALLSQVGVVVAETLDEFDDAVKTFALLRGKRALGNALGAVSNAGFECVALADNLGSFALARFSEKAAARLSEVFAAASISEIVDVHNPIDLTPMGDDDSYYETFKAVLEDEAVSVGLVGIVPFTARMNTLGKHPDHSEDVSLDTALPSRYGKLMAYGDKPWVAVVDAGDIYDPLCSELENRGVPVFRTADRALKSLNTWYKAMTRVKPS